MSVVPTMTVFDRPHDRGSTNSLVTDLTDRNSGTGTETVMSEQPGPKGVIPMVPPIRKP